MKKILLKKGQIFLLAYIYLLLINTLIRLVLGYTPFPKYFFLDMFYQFLFLSPLFLFKSMKYSRIYTYIVITFASFLFFANVTYYTVSGTMIYIGLIKYLGEAENVFSWSYIKWYFVLAAVTLIAGYVLVTKLVDHFFKDPIYPGPYLLSGILLSLVVFFTSTIMIQVNSVSIYRESEDIVEISGCEDGYEVINFTTTYLKSACFKKYGMTTFYLSEASLLFGNGTTGTIDYSEGSTSEYNLNYHGLLAGYNVFTIMIETGISGAISEELTPNLYFLQSEGLNFSNNYSKNKTATSEIIGFAGSYPTSDINYNYDYTDANSIYKLQIDNPYTLPYLLNDEYHTSFFHDGAGLYARNSLMGQFGFESWRHEFYDVHPSGTSRWNFRGNYELDSDYIDIVLSDMYTTDEPFYTFWTTLSTHGPYTDDAGYTEVAERDAYFEDEGYFALFDQYYDEIYYPLYGNLDSNTYSYLRHLISAFMDLDKAVGKIIDALKDAGEYDNTLFVVYGDHEAYYQKLSKTLSGASSSSDIYQYQTSLFFYNETLSSKYKEVNGLSQDDECEITTFTSPYIIVPTILDLLGIDYNEDYYYSSSFFSFKTPLDGIFYSTELAGFFTDRMYSIDLSTTDYLEGGTGEDYKDLFYEAGLAKLVKMTYIDSLYDEWLSYPE
ncbi:MAG: sulfatase-like hydrolase/transferase [Bacillales bacterium]|nr:sulfatase-like hydrolase/transferase [Bacillales bacterium]